MLKATEIDANGMRYDIKILSQHNETALEAINALRENMKDWAGPHHILDMEHELSSPLAGRDYLAELCKDDTDFAELGKIFSGRYIRFGSALLFFPENSKAPQLALEHVPIVYALQVPDRPSGIRTIEIEYESEQSESGWQFRAISSFFDVEFDEHRYYLDWRGYIGENSVLVDGFTRFVKTKGGWLARVTFHGTGFIIAKVLQVARGSEVEVIVGQELAKSLKKAGRKYRPEFEECDLDTLQGDNPNNTEDRCAVVLVHGTLSSAGAAFQYLDTKIFKPDLVNLYVYEHDTFVSVAKNAMDLAELITNKLRCSQLLFLAHSRGGLVARLAGHYLEASPHFKNKEIQVFSYGTPHLGTPLVNDASTVLRILTFAGSGFRRVIPIPSPLVGLAGYFLTQATQLPIGLEDMRPGSTLTEHMRYDKVFASKSISYAGQFDISATTGLKLSFLSGFSAGAIADANDGVVSVASAHGAGGTNRPAIDDCSHFDYFRNRVKSIIASDLVAWVQKYQYARDLAAIEKERQLKEDLDAIEKVFKA